MKVCHWIRGGRSEMPRFDLYLNSGVQAKETPYLLDVQSDLLQGLETRIVVPLRRRDRFPVVSLPANLMPAFEIEGVECLLETPKLAAVPLRLLKTQVASLAAKHFEITAALDFLFQGY
jgi:toxin CcdB